MLHSNRWDVMWNLPNDRVSDEIAGLCSGDPNLQGRFSARTPFCRLEQTFEHPGIRNRRERNRNCVWQCFSDAIQIAKSKRGYQYFYLEKELCIAYSCDAQYADWPALPKTEPMVEKRRRKSSVAGSTRRRRVFSENTLEK